MTLHDLYLLSPELSMVGLAIAIIVLDLLVDRKKLLHIFTIIGLIVPLSFTLSLWLAIQNDSMFSLGNAISRAPIISGMVKLPKPPTSIGIITKKIPFFSQITL